MMSSWSLPREKSETDICKRKRAVAAGIVYGRYSHMRSAIYSSCLVATALSVFILYCALLATYEILRFSGKSEAASAEQCDNQNQDPHITKQSHSCENYEKKRACEEKPETEDEFSSSPREFERSFQDTEKQHNEKYCNNEFHHIEILLLYNHMSVLHVCHVTPTVSAIRIRTDFCGYLILPDDRLPRNIRYDRD